jgi:hypothetical protein
MEAQAMNHIHEHGRGDWSIDDGSGHDSFWRYHKLGGYESWELNFDPLNYKGEGRVTVLSLWVAKEPGKTFWREQAIHEATGVQVGYLYYEE